MRIALLLIVLSGLILFATQNWSLSLAIRFLGVRTLELPLAVWVLIAIAAGFLTSCWLQILNHLQTRSLEPPSSQPKRPPRNRKRESTERRESHQTTTRQTEYTPPFREPEPPSADEASDWDDEPRESDEWDDWEEEEPQPAARPANSQTFQKDTTNFEARQEPKSVSRAGSMYSFSYREPKNSGVGKTEDVYDAEYRVITPPFYEAASAPEPESERYPETEPEEDEWGLTSEEEFEDDEPSENRPRR